jgi:hypothetical protein
MYVHVYGESSMCGYAAVETDLWTGQGELETRRRYFVKLNCCRCAFGWFHVVIIVSQYTVLFVVCLFSWRYNPLWLY